MTTLYFVPLPLSCRQPLGISARTVHVHAMTTRSSGCRAQEAAHGAGLGVVTVTIPFPLVPLLPGEMPVWEWLSWGCSPCIGASLGSGHGVSVPRPDTAPSVTHVCA